jgi:hypothetical protein
MRTPHRELWYRKRCPPPVPFIVGSLAPGMVSLGRGAFVKFESGSRNLVAKGGRRPVRLD